jgi:hypothetical protein
MNDASEMLGFANGARDGRIEWGSRGRGFKSRQPDSSDLL